MIVRSNQMTFLNLKMMKDDPILKIIPYLGKPLDKWSKSALIEEVKRLRKLEHARILDIMELQGINKGKVTTAEIDAALSQHSKKKTK
jgi:hypothetical protein